MPHMRWSAVTQVEWISFDPDGVQAQRDQREAAQPPSADLPDLSGPPDSPVCGLPMHREQLRSARAPDSGAHFPHGAELQVQLTGWWQHQDSHRLGNFQLKSLQMLEVSKIPRVIGKIHL